MLLNRSQIVVGRRKQAAAIIKIIGVTAWYSPSPYQGKNTW